MAPLHLSQRGAERSVSVPRRMHRCAHWYAHAWVAVAITCHCASMIGDGSQECEEHAYGLSPLAHASLADCTTPRAELLFGCCAIIACVWRSRGVLHFRYLVGSEGPGTRCRRWPQCGAGCKVPEKEALGRTSAHPAVPGVLGAIRAAHTHIRTSRVTRLTVEPCARLRIDNSESTTVSRQL